MGFNAFAGGKRAITAAFDDIWRTGARKRAGKNLPKIPECSTIAVAILNC